MLKKHWTAAQGEQEAVEGYCVYWLNPKFMKAPVVIPMYTKDMYTKKSDPCCKNCTIGDSINFGMVLN